MEIMIMMIQYQFLVTDTQHRHQQMQTKMRSICIALPSSTGQDEAACSTLSKELEDLLESTSTSIQFLADYPVIGEPSQRSTPHGRAVLLPNAASVLQE